MTLALGQRFSGLRLRPSFEIRALGEAQSRAHWRHGPANRLTGPDTDYNLIINRKDLEKGREMRPVSGTDGNEK